MNSEHKMLIRLMSQLSDLNARSLDKSSVVVSLNQLIDFTQQHFKDEENWMETIRYPSIDSHKKIHENLLETLDRQRTEFLKIPSGRLPTSVFDFFKNWIITHILLVDKQYSQHHKKHGSDSATI